MKRFKASDIKFEEPEASRWTEWAEYKVGKAINDCIYILENLHDSYDRYYERVALKKAIRYLERYENNEEIHFEE